MVAWLLHPAAASLARSTRPEPRTDWWPVAVGVAIGFVGAAVSLRMWWPRSSRDRTSVRWRHRIVALVWPAVIISGIAWTVGDVAVGTAKVIWLGTSGLLIGAFAALLIARPHVTRDEPLPSAPTPGRDIPIATADDGYLGPGPVRLEVRPRRSSVIVPALVVASLVSLGFGLYSPLVSAAMCAFSLWLIIDRLSTRLIGEGSELRVRRAFGERTIDLRKAVSVRLRFPFPVLIVTDDAGHRVTVPSVAWSQRDDPLLRAWIGWFLDHSSATADEETYRYLNKSWIRAYTDDTERG